MKLNTMGFLARHTSQFIPRTRAFGTIPTETIPVPKWNPEFKSRREHIPICNHSDLDRHPIPVSFWDGYTTQSLSQTVTTIHTPGSRLYIRPPIRSFGSHIEKIHTHTHQDKEDISELVKLCKNIPSLSEKLQLQDNPAWEIKFRHTYDVSQKKFEAATQSQRQNPISNNQWLQRTLSRVLTTLRPEEITIPFTLTGLYRDNYGVSPHKDTGYDTGMIPMGAFRKDNDQPLDDAYMNLLIGSPPYLEIPQNPAGGHWATFNGHQDVHFTMDHPKAQTLFGFPKKDLPHYYRLQLVVHVTQSDSGD